MHVANFTGNSQRPLRALLNCKCLHCNLSLGCRGAQGGKDTCSLKSISKQKHLISGLWQPVVAYKVDTYHKWAYFVAKRDMVI